MKKSVKSLVFSMLLLALLVLTGACTKNTGDKEVKGLNIVTSFYPIYEMTRAVSGDLNTVQMIQSGAGIHSFEPSANDIAAIEKADVFVYHSRTLEGWAKNLKENLKDSPVKVIEGSENLTLDKVPGLEDLDPGQEVDEKTLYDPHSWLDPVLVGQEVQSIAKQLSAIDPDHAAIYQKNADDYQAQAQDLVDKYQDQFKELKQKTFVTQHTAFSYLANRFGLRQLGISGISPEQEPSAQQMAEIQDFVKTYQVKTIFVEPQVSTKIAEVISQATGAQLDTLSPLEADPQNDKGLLGNIEMNLQTLLKHLQEDKK
ncbi:adhesion protein [Aerococcus loyolae]|nr:adhesion protein [Aerococcus loyolae]PKZ04720.1 adhesion protein [Aerococcus loyolae]